MSIPNFPGAPDSVAPSGNSSQKSFTATWLLSLLLGVYGVDHFYLGKVKTGIFKLFTLGGFLIWALIDLVQTVQGKRTDKYGNKIVPSPSEKKLALIVSPIVVVLLLVGAATSSESTSNSTASGSNSSSSSTTNSGMITVKDGVGLDYQSAQDLWRAQGLVVMPAEDATGADRIPVIDSNWVVVSQSPAAGTEVEEGASITATVKKYTDGDTSTTTDSGGTVVVEDAVGLDYQSAQDLWRAQGLVVMPAEDATGADRIPVIDSNWVVVSQSPAAGEEVEEGSSITATVKKYTD